MWGWACYSLDEIFQSCTETNKYCLYIKGCRRNYDGMESAVSSAASTASSSNEAEVTHTLPLKVGYISYIFTDYCCVVKVLYLFNQISFRLTFSECSFHDSNMG